MGASWLVQVNEALSYLTEGQVKEGEEKVWRGKLGVKVGSKGKDRRRTCLGGMKGARGASYSQMI